MVFFQFQEISATLKKFVLIILEIKSNLVKSNPHPHLLPRVGRSWENQDDRHTSSRAEEPPLSSVPPKELQS